MSSRILRWTQTATETARGLRWLKCVVAISVVVLATCGYTAVAQAQSWGLAFGSPYPFTHSATTHDGSFPNSVIQGMDGLLYGTTPKGGDNDLGTIYVIQLESVSPRTLHHFAGPDGSGPNSLIQARDGFFYGTTYGGGGYGCGTIFRIDATGTFTTLHHFAATEGRSPTKVIQASDDAFFGLTDSGGTYGWGTVFRLAANGTFTTLHHFAATEGTGPNRLIQARNGSFYGTAYEGGDTNNGTIFRMEADGTFTTLHHFSGPDGSGPNSLIQARDDFLYGTTSGGGDWNPFGTLFRISTDGAFQPLQSTYYLWASPTSIIQASDGTFYGTLERIPGESAWSMVFRLREEWVTATEGSMTVFMFNVGEGEHPSNMIQGRDGLFYGTTGPRVISGRYTGSVFRMVDPSYLYATNADLEDQLAAARDIIADLNAQIATLRADKDALEAQVTALTSNKNALLAQVTSLTGQVNVLVGEKAALQAEVASLSAERAALQTQLTQTNMAYANGLASVENDFRLLFKSPLFVIPGATPDARFQNLMGAILGLNRGEKTGLYKQLFTGR